MSETKPLDLVTFARDFLKPPEKCTLWRLGCGCMVMRELSIGSSDPAFCPLHGATYHDKIVEGP